MIIIICYYYYYIYQLQYKSDIKEKSSMNVDAIGVARKKLLNTVRAVYIYIILY